MTHIVHEISKRNILVSHIFKIMTHKIITLFLKKHGIFKNDIYLINGINKFLHMLQNIIFYTLCTHLVRGRS